MVRLAKVIRPLGSVATMASTELWTMFSRVSLVPRSSWAGLLELRPALFQGGHHPVEGFGELSDFVPGSHGNDLGEIPFRHFFGDPQELPDGFDQELAEVESQNHPDQDRLDGKDPGIGLGLAVGHLDGHPGKIDGLFGHFFELVTQGLQFGNVFLCLGLLFGTSRTSMTRWYSFKIAWARMKREDDIIPLLKRFMMGEGFSGPGRRPL